MEPALERPIDLAEMNSRAFGDACATVRELLVREGVFGRPDAAVSGRAGYSRIAESMSERALRSSLLAL